MLAISQSQSGASTLTLDLPTALSVRVINALKADPKTLDLRAQAPHFYALGARMLELFEEDELGEVLNDVSEATSAVMPHLLTFSGARHLRSEPRKSRIRLKIHAEL